MQKIYEIEGEFVEVQWGSFEMKRRKRSKKLVLGWKEKLKGKWAKFY